MNSLPISIWKWVSFFAPRREGSRELGVRSQEVGVGSEELVICRDAPGSIRIAEYIDY